MGNKGFTLTELLAVILILSLLSIITSATIINVVNNSKKEISEVQMDLIKSSIELWESDNKDQMPNDGECKYITLKTLKDYGILDQNIVDAMTNKQIDSNLKIKITSHKNDIGNLVSSYEVNPQILYGCVSIDAYIDESGANVPKLMDSLTPVIYEDGSWKVADETKKWYDYDNQEWANAVILKDGVSKNVGTLLTVPEEENDFESSDILAMFVWIPRFEYKINENTKGTKSTCVNLDEEYDCYLTPGKIEVNFISKNEDKATEGYIIHPGFTFGSDVLSGIWVGKFETSHETLSSSTTNDNLECTDMKCDNASGLRIIPNVASLRKNNIANFFYASRNMKNVTEFNIDSSKTDTHMMKNSEWGAVSYLAQSIYGKYGNSSYQGENKEIFKNDSSRYLTGKSSGKPSESGSKAKGTYSYNEEYTGTGASTTGNIYGIYDMSGGAYEYVMAVYNSTIKSSGFDSAFFSNEDNLKYYDLYTNEDVSIACNNKKCFGQALNETEHWYSDNSIFVSSKYPWLRRGEYSVQDIIAGIFSFNYSTGYAIGSDSFRIVLAPILGY